MYPNRIILHHSLTKDGSTVNWNAIRKYHLSKGWNDIGYHFGIEKIGSRYEVLTGRMMTVKGAHTKGHNQDSIGICLVGNFDEVKPPKEQWELAVELVSSLCEILFITRESVYTHNDFASYKTCAGKKFNLRLFRSQIH